MTKFLSVFLEELKKNIKINSVLPIGQTVWDSYIEEANKLKEPLAESLFILDNDYGVFEVVDGKIIYPGDIGPIHSMPQATVVNIVNNELWIGSSSVAMRRYDENFSDLGEIGYYGSFTSSSRPNGYQMVDDFCFDEANGRLLILSTAESVVRVFSITTMEKEFDIGIAGSAGELDFGRLKKPNGVGVLPNGDIVVSCMNGTVDGSVVSNSGHVSIFSSVDGAYISSPLFYRCSGTAESGDIYYPRSIKVIGKDVWVNNAAKLQISCFDSETWEHKKSYFKPTEFMGSTSSIINDFDVDDNYVYMSFSNANWLVRINRQNSDVEGYITKDQIMGTDNLMKVEYSINFSSCTVDEHHIYVLDSSSKYIHRFPLILFDLVDKNPASIEVKYKEPEDAHNGIFSPLKIDEKGHGYIPYADVANKKVPERVYRIYK